jgi:hypothetical protein
VAQSHTSTSIDVHGRVPQVAEQAGQNWNDADKRRQVNAMAISALVVASVS